MALVLSAEVCLCDRFLLDRRRGRLCEREGGTAVSIGSRALAILIVLIERPGDLVSKDAIMDAVWPGIAVEESNLTVQISALRRILDAGASKGRCIQTVPGRGYRFVGSVVPVEPSSNSAVTASIAPDLAIRDDAEAGSRSGAIIFPPPSYPATPSTVSVSWWQPSGRRVATMSAAACLAVLLLVVMLLAGTGSALFPTPESRTAGDGTAPPLSIVVLPFTDLSAARDQQYFVDAITEDLTADLSRLSGAFVISSNTGFTYRDRRADTRTIGRELGVRYVVGGSIRRAGEQVRVTAQLIDAETDAHLWSERFDSEHGDLLSLQNAITARIANTLGAELIRDAAARPPAARPDASDLILRGRGAIVNRQARASYAEATGLFERALALDPNSWEAQARLAGALASRVLDEVSDTVDADRERAHELLEKALAASPHDPYVRYIMAQVLRAQGRCADAIREYETALATNRNWASVYSHIGRCKVRLGLIEEAIPLYEQAIRLSPADPNIANWYFRIGEVHLLESRTEEAIGWLEKSRGANPWLPYNRMFLAAAYGLAGRREDAAAELAEARRLRDDGSYSTIARYKSCRRATCRRLPPCRTRRFTPACARRECRRSSPDGRGTGRLGSCSSVSRRKKSPGCRPGKRRFASRMRWLRSQA